MMLLDWRLALLPLVSLPVLYLSLRMLYLQTKRSARRQRKAEGRVASRISEVLASVALVQAYGREPHEEALLEEAGRETMREYVRTARLEAGNTRTTELLTAVATAAVVVFGALAVQRGAMTPGDFFSFTAALALLYGPVRQPRAS